MTPAEKRKEKARERLRKCREDVERAQATLDSKTASLHTEILRAQEYAKLSYPSIADEVGLSRPRVDQILREQRRQRGEPA